MSIDATRWAWTQSVKSTHKLVLLALADRADEHHKCYPSIRRLVADTGLNRKTIQFALNALEETQLIRRFTHQGMVNNYELIGVPDRHELSTWPENGIARKRSRGWPENGLGGSPKTGQEVALKRATESINESTNESTNESLGRTRKFVRPDIDQVRDYCLERGNRVDPERFIDHYTANGWLVGKNPMRDWKAAIRTWEKRDHETNQRTNASSAATSSGSTKRYIDKLRQLERDAEGMGDAPFPENGHDLWPTVDVISRRNGERDR